MTYEKKLTELSEKIQSYNTDASSEIGTLAMSLVDIIHKQTHRMDMIVKLSDRQQLEIMKLNDELNVYKNHLERKVEEEIAKRKEQEEALIEQSRLASMATMIDAVAHQWMQPLNIVKLKTYILNSQCQKSEEITPQKTETFQTEIYQQIDHMVETLNSFRNFFRPEQEKASFSVQDALTQTLQLVQNDLVKHMITVETVVQKNFEIYGSMHEFNHIFLNLISNTKYAFEKRNIKERKLMISIDGGARRVTVTDNAGGIDESVMDRLFDMHVTTKGKEGTGLGLYLCKQIAEKHKGELWATNIDGGAQFTFQLKDNQ
jgi:C4-dicarboxylate-specific signal transduction histidine kinase